jgi:transcriptional regulator with XRE-family HTH domain
MSILQRLREDRGLSREALAQLSGITRMGIYYIETGRRQPTVHTLRKLAKALQVPLAELLPNGSHNATTPR